jgi:hypothetical protein
MLQVTIPRYPGDQSQFQTTRISVSAEEAKILAAEVTLRQLSTSGQATAFPEGTVSAVYVQPVQSYALKCVLVYVG